MFNLRRIIKRARTRLSYRKKTDYLRSSKFKQCLVKYDEKYQFQSVSTLDNCFFVWMNLDTGKKIRDDVLNHIDYNELVRWVMDTDL